MKKINLLLISIFLFAVVFFQSVNFNSANESEVLAESYQIPTVQTENFVSAPNPESVGEITDTYYNLADEYLIMAEDQRNSGLCWSFATTKVLETYLAVNFGEYYNFSEAWVSVAYRYYIAHNTFGDNEITDYTIGDGGHYLTYMRAINTYGIMLESDFPFENYYSVGENNYEEYFNAYKDLANKDLIRDIGFEVFWGNYNNLANPITPYTRIEIINFMKEYIQNNGGFYVGLNPVFETKLDGSTFCYATQWQEGSGHAMTLIGWDDTYTCIVEETTHTGAWIALNSYSTDQKIVYVMYDDTVASSRYLGLSSLTYNGNAVDIDNPENYSGLLLTSSNSNYTNLEIADSSKLQKNIFQYSDAIVPSLTYTFSSAYAYPNFEFKICLDNVNLTEQFSLAVDNINYTFTISAKNAGLSAGNYIIEIQVDTDNNGTIDETYVKTLVIFSGAEIGIMISNGDSINYYSSFPQSQNSFFNYSNAHYAFTYSTNLLLVLKVADYSKIESFDVSSAISCFVRSESTFEPADGNNFASGNIFLQFNYINFVGVNEAILKLTTIDGFEYDYKIKIYKFDNTSVYCISRLNYFLDGGQNNAENTNAIILSSNEENYFNKQYIESPTKEHYTFNGWYFDSGFTSPLSFDEEINKYYISYADISEQKCGSSWFYGATNGINYAILYADFDITTYSITYDLDNGTAENPSSYNFYTPTFSLQTPTRTGYTFTGWSGTGIAGPTFDVTINQGSSGDKEFTAHWQENSYTIEYNANEEGGGTGSILSLENINYTSHFTTAGTESGIESDDIHIILVGWKVNATDYVLELDTQYAVASICEYAGVVENSGATITLHAVWETIGYNITYIMNGGANPVQNPSSYTYYTGTFSLLSPTKDGHTFSGWSGTDLTGTTTSVSITQGSSGDKEFTAHWQENSYTIKYNANGGTGNINDTSVSYTDNFTTAGVGVGIYHEISNLTGWFVGDAENGYFLSLNQAYTVEFICEKAGATNTDNATITLYADWVVEIYTINFYDNDGLAILRTEQKEGGTIFDFSDYAETKQATAEFTYTFVGWYENIDYTGDPITQVYVGSNIDIFAKFNIITNQYAISFYNEENELIESISYDYGTVLTFFTTTNEVKTYNQDFVAIKPNTTVQNFTFAGWYENLDYETELQSLTVATSKNIYAKYLIENLEFEINLYDENGNIYDTINYTYGGTAISLSSITLEKQATAQYFFVFAGWYDNQEFNGEPLTSILITENYSVENLYAKFTETLRSYSIIFYRNSNFDTIYDTLTYNYGETINLNVVAPIQKPSDENFYYTFDGWYDGNGDLHNEITITGNLSVYAHFDATRIYIHISAEAIQIIKIVGASVLGLVLLITIAKLIRVRKVSKFNRKRAYKKIQEIKEKQEQNKKAE